MSKSYVVSSDTQSRNIDVFLQPSKTMMSLTACFCSVYLGLIITMPCSVFIKLVLLLLSSVWIVMDIRRYVLLTSKRSIIRLGLNSSGWWLQQRNGKTFAGPLGGHSVLWQHLLVIIVQQGWRQAGVALFADSVEYRDDYRRLKHAFYVSAGKQNAEFKWLDALKTMALKNGAAFKLKLAQFFQILRR